jgi:uncharacterized membrane protein
VGIKFSVVMPIMVIVVIIMIIIMIRFTDLNPNRGGDVSNFTAVSPKELNARLTF